MALKTEWRQAPLHWKFTVCECKCVLLALLQQTLWMKIVKYHYGIYVSRSRSNRKYDQKGVTHKNIQMSSVANFVMQDYLNCLHYSSTTRCDDLVLAQQSAFLKAAWLCMLVFWQMVGFFFFFFFSFRLRLFGGTCQNLLFMLLPGTVAQNVWFKLTSPPVLAARKSAQTEVFSFSFKQDSESRQNVLRGVQWLLIDSCFMGRSTIFEKPCL